MKLTRYTATAFVLLAATGAWASSLPQMDRTWYPNQLLWLAISFAVLYAGVSLIIAPAIKSVLDTRASAISDAIREAELAKREAEATRGGSESAHHDARIRAADAMAKAQAEISAEASDQLTKLDRDLARKAEYAATILDESLQKARGGVDAAAASLAQAMAEKLLSDAGAAGSAEPKLKLATAR